VAVFACADLHKPSPRFPSPSPPDHHHRMVAVRRAELAAPAARLAELAVARGEELTAPAARLAGSPPQWPTVTPMPLAAPQRSSSSADL
jgi:hypothetical protein